MIVSSSGVANSSGRMIVNAVNRVKRRDRFDRRQRQASSEGRSSAMSERAGALVIADSNVSAVMKADRKGVSSVADRDLTVPAEIARSVKAENAARGSSAAEGFAKVEGHVFLIGANKSADRDPTDRDRIVRVLIAASVKAENAAFASSVAEGAARAKGPAFPIEANSSVDRDPTDRDLTVRVLNAESVKAENAARGSSAAEGVARAKEQAFPIGANANQEGDPTDRDRIVRVLIAGSVKAESKESVEASPRVAVPGRVAQRSEAERPVASVEDQAARASRHAKEVHADRAVHVESSVPDPDSPSLECWQ
jgi:hypothetical protein